MKKQLFSLALLLSLGTSFAGSALAADHKPANGREQRQDDHKGKGRKHDDKDRKDGPRAEQSRQRRADEMAKELGLNAKQKAKVDQIFQEQQQQMQALRGRSGQDRSQRMSEAKRIHEATDKKLKSALSKKQYAQLAAKRQERQRQRQQRPGSQRGSERRPDFGNRS
ncbi:hypothetical protein [Hymenobacter guriensis]|uniref:DUF4890 domain-containing protein n=1 Tax=Hymenobacter guriensis TaxID=2793065 RepID=A0ABS0L798_9BACT|nr:hypothetical protein [Hymenobacter guriensis]MBG8555997.1 hypothetical protein [Hymenobacter guriensis]